MQRAKLLVQQAKQYADVPRAEYVLCHATLSVNKLASPHCWLQLLEKENTGTWKAWFSLGMLDLSGVYE
jgi:hypothetical protein